MFYCSVVVIVVVVVDVMVTSFVVVVVLDFSLVLFCYCCEVNTTNNRSGPRQNPSDNKAIKP